MKVYVVAFGDRACYQLQWTDHNTNRKKTRSSKIVNDGKAKSRQAAERAAAELENQLSSNYTATTVKITWANFRERYEKEVGRGQAKRTQEKIVSTFNIVEKHLNPDRLSKLTDERVSYFTSQLRDEGKSEATIKSTLATLKSALRWAKRIKLISEAPAIDMPGRAADMSKGRPITLEEFERMLAAVPKVVKADDVFAWQRFRRGLWLCGLRIREVVNLSWSDDRLIRVDLSGKRPMLWIPAAMQKSNKTAPLPITPDFSEMLLETPVSERHGRVFLLPSRVKGEYLTADRIGKLVAKIGTKAKVVVKPAESKDKLPKFASSHDLRRSFGERWAAVLMPQQLKELMRHEDISTTMTFYVGRNAERSADAIWEAFENRKGNKTTNKQDSGEFAEVEGSDVNSR